MSTNGAFLVSTAVHASFVAALGVLPLLSDEALPAPSAAVVDADSIFVVPLPPAPADPRLVRDVPSVAPQHLTAPTVPHRQDVASDEIPIADAIGDDPLGAETAGDGPGARDGVVGSLIGDPDVTLASPPPVVRISNGLIAPRLVRRVEPVYPAIAAAARATATVLLEAEVDARGEVTRVSVVHGHPLFDAAAIEAVERWRYQPLLLNGVPTAFVLTVTVHFGLLH